jgi:hypothetical protein
MKLTDLINEEKYTIIDPKGNPAGTGTKMQANQRQKKLGGSKKGYFVVPANKALKARRTLEKYKFDFKNTKLQDLMSDLYFESVNEAKNDDKYVVIDFHEKGGGFVMTKPGSKKDAEDSARSIRKGSDISKREVLKVSDARKIRGLAGKNYLNEGNVKLSSSAKKFWTTPTKKLFGGGYNLYDTIPPSQWNTHPEIIDGFGEDAGVDIFKGFIRDNIDGKGYLDSKIAKMIGLPTNVSIIDYLNDGGSGLNGNKEFKKYGNWFSALYDIYEEMEKKFGKMKAESVNEGRAFVQAARKAKEEGKTEFEFNGKTYPVTLKESEIKLRDILNEAKLLPKGTKVIITHPKFRGDKGMVIGTGLTNGAYTVQTNGKIKSIEPKYLKVDKPDTKKEERNLKNLAGVIKIDLSEALEMLQEGGVLEAIDHLEIAIERIQDVVKDLKRKK